MIRNHLQSSISRLSLRRLQLQRPIAILPELTFPRRCLGIQLKVTNQRRTRDMAPTVPASMGVVVDLENFQISSTTRQLLRQIRSCRTRVWIRGINDESYIMSPGDDCFVQHCLVNVSRQRTRQITLSVQKL